MASLNSDCLVPCMGGPLDGKSVEYRGRMIRHAEYPPRVYSPTDGDFGKLGEVPSTEVVTLHHYVLEYVVSERYGQQRFYAHEDIAPKDAQATMLARLGWLV